MATELDYYQIAGEASRRVVGHPGLEYLKRTCKEAGKILDVGCGEGTRLNTLLSVGKSGWGIDISKKAIKLAKKKYPRLKFQVADAEKLPFVNDSFDLVYSAFAIEHSQNPQKFIDEMIRVCKKGGRIVFLCPNYGAPNRRSPNSAANPFVKLVRGLIKDFGGGSQLSWTRVSPKTGYKKIDDDTTVEPYLLSLVKYLKSKKLKVISASSVWEKEEKSANARKVLIKFLGKSGVWPFKYWGPQVFLAVLKDAP